MATINSLLVASQSSRGVTVSVFPSVQHCGIVKAKDDRRDEKLLVALMLEMLTNLASGFLSSKAGDRNRSTG